MSQIFNGYEFSHDTFIIFWYVRKGDDQAHVIVDADTVSKHKTRKV